MFLCSTHTHTHVQLLVPASRYCTAAPAAASAAFRAGNPWHCYCLFAVVTVVVVAVFVVVVVAVPLLLCVVLCRVYSP